MPARFEYTAQVLAPDYAFQTLQVKTVAIQMDENWAPSTKATLTVPYTAAIDLLDPERNDIYVQITATQHAGRALTVDELGTLYSGKTVDQLDTSVSGLTVDQLDNIYYYSYAGVAGYLAPTTRTWLLLIRRVTIDYKAGQVVLECASPEIRLQDWAYVATSDLAPPVDFVMMSTRQPVKLAMWVLSLIGETLTDWDNFEDTQYWTVDQVVMKPGVTAFDYVYQLLKKYGYLLYCRYDGKFVLRQARYYGESAPTLTLNYASNLKTLEVDRSRDTDYYTAAIINYRWTNSAGTQLTAVDAYDSGQLPKKVYTSTAEVPFPGAGVAQNVLATVQKTARTFKATAVADLASTWLSIAASVTLATETKAGYIQAIEIQHPSDEMTVTIRQGN